ncbi:MAG: PmoA family protein [Chthoniobacter sp.]|nr:PmoA family protein [Chthoniobacter sp.]
MRIPFSLCSALLALTLTARADVVMKKQEDRVRVEIGGELFTEYRFTGASHVYFWPLIGPGGARMTRGWPMQDTPGEEHDHPHHRSLWFAHGLVNGVDFWSEQATAGAGVQKLPLGKIEHVKFLEVKGGEKEGVIRDELRWVAPDGRVSLTSVQTFRVEDGAERIIDFTMTLTAGEKDVVFGDTKEGTMALRIAESMRLLGPGKKPGAGKIVNAAGDADGKVWGRRAAWVDYAGPVDGKLVGIAVFEHPKNPRHPTRWHARDYGLFAANPFCERDMDRTQPAGAGDFKLEAGKSATFSYRIILHAGDATQAKIAERFAEYATAAK